MIVFSAHVTHIQRTLTSLGLIHSSLKVSLYCCILANFLLSMWLHLLVVYVVLGSLEKVTLCLCV